METHHTAEAGTHRAAHAAASSRSFAQRILAVAPIQLILWAASYRGKFTLDMEKRERVDYFDPIGYDGRGP